MIKYKGKTYNIGDKIAGHTILGKSDRKYYVIFECKHCGRIFENLMTFIYNERCVSCGCVKNRKLGERSTTHGDMKYTSKNKYMHYLWKSIKQRCIDTNANVYKNYGGKGITMDSKWVNHYAQFKEDILNNIGERPNDNYRLFRIDRDKGYFTSNLCWKQRNSKYS